MAAIYLTRKGYHHLHEELQHLLEVRRPQVMADLTQAREYGDISENAEYETAKRDQGLIEGRIHELERLLASVEIVSVPENVEEGMLGAKMHVENLTAGGKREFTLVAEQESSVSSDYLSIESPLGKSLLGKRVGDEVVFEAPAGTRRFKVLEICRADNDDCADDE